MTTRKDFFAVAENHQAFDQSVHKLMPYWVGDEGTEFVFFVPPGYQSITGIGEALRDVTLRMNRIQKLFGQFTWYKPPLNSGKVFHGRNVFASIPVGQFGVIRDPAGNIVADYRHYMAGTTSSLWGTDCRDDLFHGFLNKVMQSSPVYEPVLPYELARSYYFFGDRLNNDATIAHKNESVSLDMSTSFAIFNRYWGMLHAEMAIAPWNLAGTPVSYIDYLKLCHDFLGKYATDSNAGFINTFVKKQPVAGAPTGLSLADLMAFKLTWLTTVKNDPAFIQRMQTAFHGIGASKSAIDVVDNLTIAICAGWQLDIAGWVSSNFKWPISARCLDFCKKVFPASGRSDFTALDHPDSFQAQATTELARRMDNLLQPSPDRA